MKQPQAVLISDVHYNVQNLPLADKVMRMALDKSTELRVPCIIAGDLHDTKAMMRGECVNAMIETFGNRAHDVYIIPGNHCRLNEKSEEHSLVFLEQYATVVNKVCLNDEWADWQFYLVPYHHDADALRRHLDRIPDKATVIAHQGVQGANMGHYTMDKTSLPKEAWARFRTVSGHYHRRQDIMCTPELRKNLVGRFSYLGSPYSQNFGEADDGEKGFSILYSDGSLELVPTNLRKHVVLNTDVKGCYGPIPNLHADDLLWLKVTGTASELAQLNKQEIGRRLLGHSNFKFDKICTESAKPEIKETMTEMEILDRLIDSTPEDARQKKYLKNLSRELLDAPDQS